MAPAGLFIILLIGVAVFLLYQVFTVEGQAAGEGVSKRTGDKSKKPVTQSPPQRNRERQKSLHKPNPLHQQNHW